MRDSDIDWVAQIILSSGIGTKTQRQAIVQRVYDAYHERGGRELSVPERYPQNR